MIRILLLVYFLLLSRVYCASTLFVGETIEKQRQRCVFSKFSLHCELSVTLSLGDVSTFHAINDENKSFIVRSCAVNGTDPGSHHVIASFSGESSVRVWRAEAVDYVSCTIQVLEFESGVSVIHGSTDFTQEPVVPVPIDNSFIMYMYEKMGNVWDVDDFPYVTLYMDGSQNVRVKTELFSTVNPGTVHYSVITVENSHVHRRHITILYDALTATSAVLPTLALPRTMLLVGHQLQNSTIACDDGGGGAIEPSISNMIVDAKFINDNGLKVLVRRGVASAACSVQIRAFAQVIEFNHDMVPDGRVVGGEITLAGEVQKGLSFAPMIFTQTALFHTHMENFGRLQWGGTGRIGVGMQRCLLETIVDEFRTTCLRGDWESGAADSVAFHVQAVEFAHREAPTTTSTAPPPPPPETTKVVLAISTSTASVDPLTSSTVVDGTALPTTTSGTTSATAAVSDTSATVGTTAPIDATNTGGASTSMDTVIGGGGNDDDDDNGIDTALVAALGVIGVIILCLLAALLFLCVSRRRKRSQRSLDSAMLQKRDGVARGRSQRQSSNPSRHTSRSVSRQSTRQFLHYAPVPTPVHSPTGTTLPKSPRHLHPNSATGVYSSVNALSVSSADTMLHRRRSRAVNADHVSVATSEYDCVPNLFNQQHRPSVPHYDSVHAMATPTQPGNVYGHAPHVASNQIRYEALPPTQI